ncbi:histidine phosphatase family protein [Candidatus Woesearchaeota archaeon]|nr:histidine phosphatase family protein [Candidatus Woesearchaeota archaeon]
MRCTIYLFRHGQTYFNQRKMFTGWKDSKWTADGKKNAYAVAKKLKSKKIDVTFCTKLARSRETLKSVLQFHQQVLVLRDDRMIERCYGDLQGKSHAVFIRDFGKELFDTYHRSYNVPPPNGESVKMVEKRVGSFIKDLIRFIKKYKVNVAISAHGNSMRPFRRHFEKASVGQMMGWTMPYDDFFEYSIEVREGEVKKPKKSDWPAVHLPNHVFKAADKHNVLKKYY